MVWCVAAAFLLLTAASAACPFCTALRPPWAKQRESAVSVDLAECLAAPDPALGTAARFRVHQGFKGDSPPAVTIDVEADRAAGCVAGRLALVFDEGGEPPRRKASPVSELAVQYFARAPESRRPAAERLPYFLRYLEHDDPSVAEDAYLEFGLADYEAVRAQGPAFDSAALRRWLVDPQVPPERKGFYGLALGVAAVAQRQERAANLALLEAQVAAPASDFRAGFDGVLGGYLAARGVDALAEIERRYFRDPASREGDVRHALAAVRFAAEFLPEVPRPQLAGSVRRLLQRPEFAAEAIVDLARWEDWTSLDAVAALYGKADYPQPATDRAVVGYLSVCPQDEATDALEALRRRDPEGVAAAERVLRQLGRVRD